MEAVSTEPFDAKGRFPKVFTGLGTLGEEYMICLKEDARPHALHTPRNVPLPLRDKIREELDRMEEMGVISKVNEPTPWCAGMVVVPKKSGAVRIYVDLKALNENVLRETHPIPKVDDTLAYSISQEQQFSASWMPTAGLANPAVRLVEAVHHLYHLLWTIRIQQVTIQYFKYARIISEKNE